MYRAGCMTHGGGAGIDLGRGTNVRRQEETEKNEGIRSARRADSGRIAHGALGRRASVDTAAQACQEALPRLSISQSFNPDCMPMTAALPRGQFSRAVDTRHSA
jgi:hypothetical protein